MTPQKYARWLAGAQLLAAMLGLLGWLTAENPAEWLAAYTLAALGVTLFCSWSLYDPRILRSLMQNRLTAYPIVLGLLAFFAWGLWGTAIERLPSLWLYLPCVILWPWLTLGFLLVTSERPRAVWLVRVALQLVVMTVITLGMLEGLMRLFVDSLPYELVERIPYQSVGFSFTDNPEVDYIEDQKSLDLYRLTCLHYDAEQSEEPYRVQYTLDENGFRGTTQDQADLMVLGDSFTLAARIPEPYWMIGADVYAMGANGGGTLNEQSNLMQFGFQHAPKVVVLAYFEGNDLQDNWETLSAAMATPVGEVAKPYQNFRPLRFLAVYSAGLWALDQVENNVLPCVYPLEDAYGNKVAFYPPYVSMATVERNALTESSAFQATEEAILEMKAEVEANGATFVVMFIPDKLHIHFDALDETGEIAVLAENVDAFTYSSNGFIPDPTVTDAGEVANRLRRNHDNQRALLAELAEENEILFLDLTPAFVESVEAGKVPFSYGDTHWNRYGHALAGEQLRAFLADHIPDMQFD
jgi:hypothetical protein